MLIQTNFSKSPKKLTHKEFITQLHLTYLWCGKICRVGLCTEQFYAIIPTLFLYFLLICYPYILNRKAAWLPHPAMHRRVLNGCLGYWLFSQCSKCSTWLYVTVCTPRNHPMSYHYVCVGACVCMYVSVTKSFWRIATITITKSFYRMQKLSITKLKLPVKYGFCWPPITHAVVFY